MATTVIDTAGWQVVVPLKPALKLAGSRLTATLAPQFGGTVVDLDSAVLVPGYDGTHQIDWTADANGLTDRLVLTATRAMRGSWLAAGPNGLPGLVTLFADVKRTVAGSGRDPELLTRASFAVVPGTDSPAVAAAAGSFQAVLSTQGFQTITATATAIGPQGPGFPFPDFDPVADAGKTFGLRVVDGALVWVVLNGSATPDPGGGSGLAAGTLDFSDPANSGLLALFPFGLPVVTAQVSGTGVLDFSDPANSGLLALFPLGPPEA